MRERAEDGNPRAGFGNLLDDSPGEQGGTRAQLAEFQLKVKERKQRNDARKRDAAQDRAAAKVKNAQSRMVSALAKVKRKSPDSGVQQQQ